MIKPSSFTHDWICKVSKENKADRILVEKAIRALLCSKVLQIPRFRLSSKEELPNADVSKAASPFYRH